MATVAIIPARGGSKGVPGKNLRPIGGIPLVGRAVRACRAARMIDHIYVSTDDQAIAEAAQQAGARVITRPADLAGDLATSESALLHGLDEVAAEGIDPTVLVFVQCTSPFIQGNDLDAAVNKINSDQADSVFSGISTYEFLWRDADEDTEPGSGPVIGQNHDASYRPRRQDRRPDFRETGAFYAMRVDGFRRHKHRFFGRIGVVPVSELSSLEIDTAEELALADAFAGVLDKPAGDGTHGVHAIDVDAVITDFDGVHTADTAYVDEDGHEHVRVSRSDGMGVGMLRKAGVPFLILSKERNPVVTARAKKLGVEVLQGIDDKATAIREWLAGNGIDPKRAAYVGNDINDLGPLSEVGVPIAVPDSHPSVLAKAKIVLRKPGGHGAVRELCEGVLAAHNARTGSESGGITADQSAATTGSTPASPNSH
ncbi:cytidylyltransferase domain-containing protein [Propionibacteriaceae bacterium Y1700]|uniref:cytidylyltransferase domain-containing protein n=1 Tax=Microlunatus sp. Y1700 TaxID=3418487 RepID=UPI003DA6FC31